MCLMLCDKCPTNTIGCRRHVCNVMRQMSRKRHLLYATCDWCYATNAPQTPLVVCDKCLMLCDKCSANAIGCMRHVFDVMRHMLRKRNWLYATCVWCYATNAPQKPFNLVVGDMCLMLCDKCPTNAIGCRRHLFNVMRQMSHKRHWLSATCV